MIKAQQSRSETVEITFTGTRDEFLELHDATRPGRRSRAQLRLLEKLGNEIYQAVRLGGDQEPIDERTAGD